MRLSICVPTLGKRPDCLDRLVQSIKEHTEDYEIIIVSDGRGIHTKLNECIRRSTGDYLTYLHDDCVVTPGWAEVLADAGSLRQLENDGDPPLWGCHIGHDHLGMIADEEHPINFTPWPVFSRRVQDRVGLWDEHYHTPSYQDAEWGMVVTQLGFEFVILPGGILHYPAKEGRESYIGAQGEYFQQKWFREHFPMENDAYESLLATLRPRAV